MADACINRGIFVNIYSGSNSAANSLRLKPDLHADLRFLAYYIRAFLTCITDSSSCHCKPGFIPSSGSLTCTEDLCEGYCQNNGTCTLDDSNTNPTCDCPEGYHGDTCCGKSIISGVTRDHISGNGTLCNKGCIMIYTVFFCS